jgi:hypothetical protein
MGIKDLILKLRNADVKNPLDYRVDDNEGIDFNIENEALKNIEKSALESPLFGMQLSYLRGLHEQGLAEKNATTFLNYLICQIHMKEDIKLIFEEILPKRLSQLACS